MIHLRDDELIRGIQSGDTSALDKIIETYYKEVFQFLCRKLSNFEAAQDVTQTVFTKFAATFSRYDERGKLRNYLFKLAANAGNDWFRKKTDFVPLDELQEFESNESTPEESTINRDTAATVKRSLQMLPDFQRDVIILRFYHDLPFKDIARITGHNLSSTKSRYRQGMEKLKNLLKKEIYYE